MKRREAEKEMEERQDEEIRRRKAETDRLFLLYQQEKDKKRKEDAHAISDLHLKQAVGHSIAFSLSRYPLFSFSARTKRS